MIAAGNVSTHANAMLMTVLHCKPDPFAAIVPAMPEDSTAAPGKPKTVTIHRDRIHAALRDLWACAKTLGADADPLISLNRSGSLRSGY